jgi:hypothetical protein
MMDVVLNGSCTQLLQGSQSRRQRRLEHQHKQYSMQTSRQQGSQYDSKQQEGRAISMTASSMRAGQTATGQATRDSHVALAQQTE